MRGTASDNMFVASVKLKLQRKRGSVIEYWNGNEFTTAVALVEASYNGGNGTWAYSKSIPASQLDKGGYTLYATAYDAAGNFTTSPSRSFTVVGTPSAADAVSAAGSSAGGS